MTEDDLVETFAAALGLQTVPYAFTGSGGLESAFAVSEFAAAAVATAGIAASRLSDDPAPVTVDRGLAAAWFGAALMPVAWQLPSPWDALAGDYASADGWIRLHTNAPRHRAAALAVLGTPAERSAVEAAVAAWAGDELERAVVSAGGCAAVIRSPEEWARHPQGIAVASEPLVGWTSGGFAAARENWRPTGERPLAGLRVLDLTRVIAGPVATRFLASLGADVLRVDPPDWDEPAIMPEMTLGKRAARIDATTTVGRDALERLVAHSDVLVHGYRPGALDDLVSPERRRDLRPGLIEVSLDAYGWRGPWSARRGFDSLVQMSSGIAEAGMHWAEADRPTPLPVQALDHATGYLAAAAALVAIGRMRRESVSSSARLSLARTALELPRSLSPSKGDHSQALRQAQGPTTRITTPWGPADLLASPLTVGDIAFNYERGPTELGSDEPRW
ncbi:CoA transferase [Conyzicola nivalis]|uniref:Coa transferase caib/baif family protein n=1 Tax=Conyzicola nivalis TaxID=1477021 RepID=A0A916ST81_9MICO|nr:CoA transferase [Conyzicola nivalis]GGB14713.1 coa transferase caib/baif family protein [Conyzicola nivalis]